MYFCTTTVLRAHVEYTLVCRFACLSERFASGLLFVYIFCCLHE